MGRVFLGVSPGGRPVAVKAIRAELAVNPEFRARFGREVAAARRVSGVFTAQVVDADVDGPVAWMATAYVPGPSLAEAVDTHGPLPEASLLALAAGLSESLHAIHEAGVVHRDLKPSNVLLAEDGPRVIDFGISRATESTMLTQAGLVVGSPGFMSPEQATGYEVGPPSDIFNLGAVLAFAATGEGPFGTGTTAALLYRVVHGAPSLDLVPPTVRPLIEHCLAKDPRQRPTANGLLANVGAMQPGGNWLPDSLTRTFAQGTPSRPGFAWSGPVIPASGPVPVGSNPALAGTASAYAPPAAPPVTPPPPTGLGATRTTAGGSGASGPFRAADAGPGQLAVHRVYSPHGGVPAGHSPAHGFGHGPAAAAAAPDEAAGAGADPRRHRRGGRRDGLRAELDEPLHDTPAGSTRGRDVVGVAALVRTGQRVLVPLAEPVFLLAEHVPVAAGLHAVFVQFAGAPVDDADHVHHADDIDHADDVHDADDIHHADHVHVHVVGFRTGQHVYVVKLVVVRAGVKLVQFGEFSEFGDLRTGLPVRIALTCNGTYQADRESPGGRSGLRPQVRNSRPDIMTVSGSTRCGRAAASSSSSSAAVARPISSTWGRMARTRSSRTVRRELACGYICTLASTSTCSSPARRRSPGTRRPTHGSAPWRLKATVKMSQSRSKAGCGG